MTKRNIMNDRYIEDEEKRKGKTRKSASSARPTREAAGSVYVVSNKKSKKQLKEEQRKKDDEERRIEEAVRGRIGGETTNDVIKKWRRIWWVTLVAAIVCTLLSWFARDMLPEAAMYVLMGLAYAFIIAALYIDLGKIRKERKKLEAEMARSSDMKKIYSEEKKRVRAEMRAENKEAKERAKSGEPEPGDDQGVVGRVKAAFGFKSSMKRATSEQQTEQKQ